MTYTKDNLRQIFQQPFYANEWQQMLRHYFQATELRAEPERIDGTTEDEQGYYLGAIDTTDSYRIGLFYYQIQHGNVARKRVGLRNLVKSFVNPNWGEFDAALVVFDSGELWRLSFVSDIKGESTAPKRYTYIFGESDSFYNTPVGRFDALQRKGISFENIKEAFSVEALSKEFFDEYREHYADIVEYITGKRYVKEKGKWVEKTIHEPCHEIFDQFVAVYKDPEKTVRDYIKKLMGRLVFLQFLQKKEWMGVPADRLDWKGGDTRFLQNKFNEFADRDNFIDGFLEPLFNDLNTNRQNNNDLASPEVGSDIKIPFLNGGLFQLDEEDCSNIRLPQHLLGDVLDFFERYNFTIDENDPNDAQIGVDPEMLGRVFENLLEDNNDKGAFYTPKEIVQYMCQESLIAYLQTGIDDEANKESIRQFVLTHEAEHLGSMAEDISIKLLNVKICDPAIGSGAFPMGLLRQLYLCQCAIHPELEEKNAADVKRHIIQNNIYGVDIEKGAVDIARLRFWLSLIVDEATPRFLPNLDFKIMQGNSLLEHYKGVDLSKMTTLSTEQGEGTQLTWFDKELDILRFDLCEKLNEYYNCSGHQRKEQLKQEIIDNVKQQLHEQSINVDFGNLDLSANDQFTLWHTWFYDVFSQGGFDIVIGNPPYISANDLKKQLGTIQYNKLKSLYETSKGAVDFYVYFFEAGISLLKSMGVLSYITPNKYFSANYGKALRQYFINHVEFIEFFDVSRNEIFDASVYPIIVTLSKTTTRKTYHFSVIDKNLKAKSLSSSQLGFLPDNIWGYMLCSNYSLLGKIINNSKPITEVCQVNATSTASEADDYHNYINEADTHGLKLINTGTIDPFISKWGKQKLVDKGEKYLTPYLPNSRRILGTNRYNMYNSPKIIVAKMALSVEGFYDENGDYSSINTNCFHTITVNPKVLLAWIHSSIFLYMYGCFFEGLKMAGGFLPFSAPYLSSMYFPTYEGNVGELEDIVDSVITKQQYTFEARKKIDTYFYRLYDLTYDEVLIVDPETPITREEYENS